MNLAQLRALAVSTGFEDPDTAAAIAMAESGGDPTAIGDKGTSFGLWQVHTPAWPQFDQNSLLDPTYNAKAALVISQGGSVWTPWSTFNSGAYLQYLPTVHLARVAPTLKLIAGAAAVSWVAAGIIRHGGIANAWHAAGRSLRRYV